MPIRVYADCVLPIAAPPIGDGWVDVDAAAGRIVTVGASSAEPRHVRRDDAHDGSRAPLDLGHVAILPGLVNAHTHLELTHLRDRVPPAADFLAWVTALLAARNLEPAADADVIAAALDEAVAGGTVALADIGNTRAAVGPLTHASVDAWHFDERLGFRRTGAEAIAQEAWAQADREASAIASARVRRGVAPHAPYSTAPELIAAIAAGLESDEARRSSLHVAESPEEGQLLDDGSGPWRTLLERVGVWEPAWLPPGTSTVAYLEQLGVLHPRLLLVHGTQCSRDDLARIARAGCTLVLCPRSNAWVGVGAPPVAAAFEARVRVAVGTDSLASVSDLNVFAELAALRRLAPEVPASALLQAATINGAEALGFTHLGALAPGRSSRALVIDLPTHVTAGGEVEEWLVSGEPAAARLRWLDDCVARQEAA